MLQSGVGQVHLFQNNRRPQEFYLKESTDSINFVEKTKKSQRTLYFFNGHIRQNNLVPRAFRTKGSPNSVLSAEEVKIPLVARQHCVKRWKDYH